MAGIRYDINRVYQSRCQNMECRETVTVTAPSEAVAEELFSQFEKGTNQPQLTIPKSVADSIKIGKSKLTPALAIRWKGSLYNLTTGNIKLSKESLNWVLNGKSEKEVEDRNLVLFAYLNPLTRDLVKVVDE